MKNEYIELRRRQQTEYNSLPLGAAFNDKQFKDMMDNWGLCIGDTDKIARVVGGMFIQKKDLNHFHEVVNKFCKEIEDAIAADKTGDGFIYQMFLTELLDHEYSYTGDAGDALDELGYTLDDIHADPRLLHGFNKAVARAAEEE